MKLNARLYQNGPDSHEKHAMFRMLFDDLYKSLCIYVFNFTHDDQVSEDIVVDTFVKLWEDYHSIRNQAAMRAWLYQVSRNKSLNWLKSRQLKHKKEEDFAKMQSSFSADISSLIIHAEAVAELHSLIDKLPVQCSRVFTKLFIEGKNIRETAVELNVSVNTVKSQKNRGLQLLRLKLRPVLLFLSLLFLQNMLPL
ncbi:RNA polymerase sigma-70 factor [Flavitalea sp.]|nr:RNA polymerase sigma-70 factor [Flavitalea sp.]